MHLQTIRTSLLAAAVGFLMGCGPAANEPADGGADGGTGVVTYTKDVQPILKAKCAPCHTDSAAANHNVATNYADVNKPVEAFDFGVCWNDTEMTMPKKVGECALLLINSGQMPLGAGCGSPTPLQPEACLTAAQKGVIAAWVAAGMPQ